MITFTLICVLVRKVVHMKGCITATRRTLLITSLSVCLSPNFICSDIGMGGFVPGTQNLVSSVSECFRNQWAVLEAQGKVEVDYSITANRSEAQVHVCP